VTEVVGLFSNRGAAESAVDQLFSLGYDASSVGYMDRSGEVVADAGYEDAGYEDDGNPDDTGTAGEEAVKGAGGGAIGGAAVGAGAGLLASAGLLAMPGIGPFLAAGTLAATLGGAAAGAAGGAALGGVAGAILGATTDEGTFNEDDTSSYYRNQVQGGGALVTVEVFEGRQAEVAAIMYDAGAEKVDVYGDKGWM
jgi:hypothetical protein